MQLTWHVQWAALQPWSQQQWSPLPQASKIVPSHGPFSPLLNWDTDIVAGALALALAFANRKIQTMIAKIMIATRHRIAAAAAATVYIMSKKK
jgi:hypothetical protein